MVHKYNIVFDVLRQLKCSFAASYGIDYNLCVTKKFGYNHEVGFIVVNHQDSCFGRFEFLLVCALLTVSVVLFEIVFTNLLVIYKLLGNLNDECRALGINAVNSDFTAHQIKKLLYN